MSDTVRRQFSEIARMIQSPRREVVAFVTGPPRQKRPRGRTRLAPVTIDAEALPQVPPRKCSSVPMSVSPRVAVSRVIFAAGLALAPLTAGGEAVAQSKLEASYTISFARIPVGSITATSEIGNAEYITTMSGRASGMLRVFAGGEGTLAATGRGGDGRLIPLHYQTNTTPADDDSLDVTMTFEDGNVKDLPASAPPPAADRVAVSEGDRRGVVDPLTALLVPAADGGDGIAEPSCQRTLAIFDGRRHFDLRLAFKRIDTVKAEQGYAGPAVVCAVTF